MPQATEYQFMIEAAGSAGLIARVNENSGSGEVAVYNPQQYTSLSEHVELISQQAIDLWRSFLLTYHSDARNANVHLALGLLMFGIDQPIEAIAEFKLVANRYAQSSAAPFALLHSSRIKTTLLDYAGAKNDLGQLIEQYPEAEISDSAYLYLAQATMKAGYYEEALRLYKKVYNLDMALTSQTKAALGAGKCSYRINDYEGAEKWLQRYIKFAKDKKESLYSAYYLLGKSTIAMGKHAKACAAFKSALKGPLTREEYMDSVSKLIQAYKAQDDYVAALYVIENVRDEIFSKNEIIELQLVRVDILRSMGLVDKAMRILGDKADHITDTNLKVKVLYELIKCQIAAKELDTARKSLTQVLTLTESGPLAHQAAIDLASVCYEKGDDAQAVSVCSQLLDLYPSEEIKQKALRLLAAAYDRQNNYDKAILALAGEWTKADSPKEEAVQK
jgi:tetratricopeptide (TPR) repeat protein